MSAVRAAAGGPGKAPAGARTDGHDCPVRICELDVRADRLMCPPHWRMVPKPLQRAVYAAWQDGAGAGSTAHWAACQAAIRAVERQLGAGR